MKYCPYCHRINAGRPQICNYCGRTWYVRLCNRGHENSYDAQFCGTCGSADLTDTAGGTPWWSYMFRILPWSILILFIVSLGRGPYQLSPQLINLIIPVLLLIFGYALVVSMAPWPLKGLLAFINRKLKFFLSKILVWFWDLIKWILFDNRNSRDN